MSCGTVRAIMEQAFLNQIGGVYLLCEPDEGIGPTFPRFFG